MITCRGGRSSPPRILPPLPIRTPTDRHTVVQLRHALAGEVAPVVEASLGKRNAETAIQVLADLRGNRLVVIGPATVRQRLIELVRGLDVIDRALEVTDAEVAS